VEELGVLISKDAGADFPILVPVDGQLLGLFLGDLIDEVAQRRFSVEEEALLFEEVIMAISNLQFLMMSTGERFHCLRSAGIASGASLGERCRGCSWSRLCHAEATSGAKAYSPLLQESVKIKLVKLVYFDFKLVVSPPMAD
jgi:hypothetical protein